ncbi:MAG: tRNA pseudouridine(55) synthase TruB [Patescibacteria group bacterium]
MDGFILIDKPAGVTSHDVIDELRRITGLRRIGHAGTLDPFATGLLVVGIGAATKRLAEHLHKEKEYVGTMVLGASSDTQDLTGKMIESIGAVMPDIETVRTTLHKFTGPFLQTPPMFSAKKVGGKKLYELARQGKEIERKPIEVNIHELELMKYEPPRLSIRVRCSAGTYIRTLAHDIGAQLGTGAYLESLRRTVIGELRIEDAVTLKTLTRDNWTSQLR